MAAHFGKFLPSFQTVSFFACAIRHSTSVVTPENPYFYLYVPTTKKQSLQDIFKPHLPGIALEHRIQASNLQDSQEQLHQLNLSQNEITFTSALSMKHFLPPHYLECAVYAYFRTAAQIPRPAIYSASRGTTTWQNPFSSASNIPPFAYILVSCDDLEKITREGIYCKDIHAGDPNNWTLKQHLAHSHAGNGSSIILLNATEFISPYPDSVVCRVRTQGLYIPESSQQKIGDNHFLGAYYHIAPASIEPLISTQAASISASMATTAPTLK